MAQTNVKSAVSSYAALLRGINVGGKNRLGMKDLAAIFDEAGCVQVRTYIQSGNVVFEATAECAARVPAFVRAEIEKRFGLKVPVVLRSGTQWKLVIEGNPFLRQGASPDFLHVMFLADEPSDAAVASLDPNRSTPDSFVVLGRDIFLQLPNGGARSKLTNAYFDSKLKTVSTVRNWRTVLRIDAMLSKT